MVIEKTYFLGLGISVFTENEYYRYITEIIEKDKPNVLYGYTLLLLPLIRKNPEMIDYCNTFDLLVTDGTGYYFLAKLYGMPLKFNLSIPNMVYSLLDLANKKNYSVLLFGGKEITNEKAITNLRSMYPNAKILDGINGYYKVEDEDAIVRRIALEKPDVLLIANSSPKKERFAFDHKDEFNAKVIVPCGGMVDVFAGDISLTPPLLKRMGLAWLYRFFQEPKKRFRLTLEVLTIGIKLFLYFVLHRNTINLNNKKVTEII